MSKKSTSRRSLGHTTDPTRGAKTTPHSSGNTTRHHKENLTPARPRQSFVKPRKQVFADFGVQVFAPLPRAILPERELPKPAPPAEVGCGFCTEQIIYICGIFTTSLVYATYVCVCVRVCVRVCVHAVPQSGRAPACVQHTLSGLFWRATVLSAHSCNHTTTPSLACKLCAFPCSLPLACPPPEQARQAVQQPLW